MNARSGRPGLAVVLLVGLCAVALAAALRLGRLDEMEYKFDEAWMYERAAGVLAGKPVPTIGMPSSVGLRNPGLSVWIFVALAEAGAGGSPVDLAAAVVVLNLIALALVFVFAGWVVEPGEREAWLWTGALLAVSPLAVILQRKIWAQSVLPPLGMLFLLGWYRRDRRWGSFLWGLMGGLMAQIHMSGFAFVIGFQLWERRAGRLRGGPRRAQRFWWWVAGSALGGVGLVVWFGQLALAAITKAPAEVYVLANPPASGPSPPPLFSILGLWPSYWVHWLDSACGLGLEYSLGRHLPSFFRHPLVGGHATWLGLLASLVSAAVALRVIVPRVGPLVARLRARRGLDWVRVTGESGFTLGAALLAYGVVLTVTSKQVHLHYVIIAYPLPWLWLARATLATRHGRLLLAASWAAQLALTLTFLGYIHDHHGAEGADYGRAYRYQQPAPPR